MTKKTSQQGLQYTKDEFGKEILLKDGSLPVMMEWEKSYVDACIDALKPKGNVLEVGYGLGYSATRIQKFDPQSHTIIECDPVASEKAIEFGRQYPNITIIIDTWQTTLPNLGIYDSIFFDDYVPMSAEDAKQIARNAENYGEVAESTLSLREKIAENLKSYKGIKFSDEALRDFAKQVQNQPNVAMKDVLNFIDNLEQWGNITSKQRAAFQKELSNVARDNPKMTSMAATPWIPKKLFASDHFISFVQECLNNHMRKGSRLSAYMGMPDSKKNHPEFNKLISRPDVKYSESIIKVTVPSNCPYYKGNEALVMVIEKK